MNELTVHHRTFIRASPMDLYARLTSGEGWEKWFASSAAIGGAPGEPIHFCWEDFGADHYSAEDHGEVVLLEEGTFFSFTWHPGDFATQVNFRFEPCGDGCMLSVKETGHSSASDDGVELALSVAGGWAEALTLFKYFVEYGVTYGTVPAQA